MSTCKRTKTAVLCGVALAGLVLVMLIHHSDHAQLNSSLELEDAPASRLTAAQTTLHVRANSLLAVAPFIVTDTATDSPGTNLVTRIVTLTAEIRGTPPIFLQWKVDKGSGFVAVSASATNSTLIITNAQVADTGRYSLFATNSIASTNTTPVPLVVVEGVD